MRRTLKNLQNKPEHVRERIAYMSAGVGTLGIFAVWMIAFITTQPLSLNTNIEERQQQENPFRELTQSFQTGFAGAAAALEELDTEVPTQFEGEPRLEVVETQRTEEPEGRVETLTF